MALRRNILLFHQGALGDFVLTWPIALALARIYPQSRVFYVTHSQKGKLAEKTLGVESADAEAGWHPLFGAGGALPDATGRLLAGAHSVVSFLSAPDSPFVANVKAAGADANVLAIYPNPPADFAGHATDFQLNQLRAWPAAHAAAEQILRSVQARGVGVSRRGDQKSYVLLHPGSGSSAKNWPVNHFVELARRLSAAGHSVRVVLGEVEREQWSKSTIGQLEQVGKVVWPQTYLELMDELLGAAAFVGNDSGPGHLAGALGVPTLALFGATDPARWKPLGPRVQALRHEPIDSLEVDRVFAALQKLIAAQ